MTDAVVGKTLSRDYAVGISVTRTPRGGLHAGVAYRHSGQEYLYHQAWHEHTLHEPLDSAIAGLRGSTLVVSVRIPPARQLTVVSLLKHLSRKGRNYAYALVYDADSIFSESGAFQSSQTAGLTCCGFVLSVFHNCHLPLVELETWPDASEDDLRMQASLVIRIADDDLGHAKQIVAEIGCKRIRPDHVGGAGYYEDWPVAFERAGLAAIDLVKRIDALKSGSIPSSPASDF